MTSKLQPCACFCRSGPLYKLVTTDLGGERRFASAVARRLQSLGKWLTLEDRGETMLHALQHARSFLVGYLGNITSTSLMIFRKSRMMHPNEYANYGT